MPDEVLVKLPDGSFVRKPMREVLAMAGLGGGQSVVSGSANSGSSSGGQLSVGDTAMMPATAKTVFQAPSPLRDSGITAVADRIVGQCQIGTDDVSARRLRTFVVQYLEGRAKPRELQEFLVRSEKIGGLGFNDEQAKTCGALIETELASGSFRIGDTPKPQVHSLSALSNGKVGAPSPVSVTPVPPRPTPTLAPIPSLPRPTPAVAASAPPAVAPVPVAKPASMADANEIPIPQTRATPAIQPRLIRVPTPVAAIPSASQAGNGSRPMVVDVRPPRPQATVAASTISSVATSSQVTASRGSWWGGGARSLSAGPAEEFNFSLEDFRRVADDPNERLTILQEKMGRLSKEGYAFRAKAVDQWKRSEVFAFYLTCARESLSKGHSVADTLSAQDREGKPGISIEEFTAIGQFNRWLGL